MILNPRCKLSIFSEKTWSDTDPEPYKQECRSRFELDYISTATTDSSSSLGTKRSAPNDDDDDDYEFHALLAERAAIRARIHDFDRYINVPNDPSIKSVLGGGLIKPLFQIWQRWREIHWRSLHLVAPLRGCSASPDELRLGRGVVSATAQSLT